MATNSSQTLDQLLTKVEGLPLVKQKAVSGLVGAVVGDVASSPLLWIYKDDDLKSAIASHVDSPEFHDPTANPFYRVPCGSLSHYGDQILPILRSLAECQEFNPANYNDYLIKAFGRDSPYHRDYSNVKYPIEGPYQNSTIKRFNQLYPEGKSAVDLPTDTNDEPDCIGRIAPVVTKWAGSPDLHSNAEQSVTLLQCNEMVLSVVGVASRIMEYYVLNDEANCNPIKIIDSISSSSDVSDDQKQIADLLQAVITDKEHLSVSQATTKYGKGCSLPGSLQSSFRSLLDERGYVPALREVIVAGGSSCSRAIFVGYCLGAKYGIKGIPRDWMERSRGVLTEVLPLALQLIQD